MADKMYTGARSPKARVKKGAALLDQAIPGWWRRVVFNRLDMGDCNSCVLGQVYAGGANKVPGYEEDGFNFGCRELGLTQRQTAGSLGFDCYKDEDWITFHLLRDFWIEEISARRKASRAKAHAA